LTNVINKALEDRKYCAAVFLDVSQAFDRGKQVNITIKQLNWLLGRKSNLAIENKLLIYKTIIILIWKCGLELWGCASKSNISIIQRSQSKILRMIVDALWQFPSLFDASDPL
jgi:hypothetical protein